MKQQPRQTFNQLMARCVTAGLTEVFVRRHILPDWWSPYCDKDPLLVTEFEIRLARFLGVGLAVVRDHAHELPKVLPGCKVAELPASVHTAHCEKRRAFGDGECECAERS